MSTGDDLTAAGRAALRGWRIDDALAAAEHALRLAPDDAAAHYLRGEALFLLRRLDEALAAHNEAFRCGIDRDCDTRGAAMSGMVPGDFAWMSHMLRGDFAAAWRLAAAGREARRRTRVTGADWPRQWRPVWDGSPLAGRRVLLRCYHGLGDTIQFIRYAPLLAESGAAVCVEAQPALLDLLTTVPGIARLCSLPDAWEHDCGELGCEVEADVTELPDAFGTTLDTVPAAVPYLRADSERARAAGERLARAAQGRFKVGLVWAAGEWKPERSLAPALLARLGDIPGIAWVSLQRGPAAQRRPGALPFVVELNSDDVGETAAVISGLDLVITVDTMVAHLAGALGAPVWLMLHKAADWRWLLDRSDSPWYPTMRLFRQSRLGDWASVVAAIAAALRREGEARVRQLRYQPPSTPIAWPVTKAASSEAR